MTVTDRTTPGSPAADAEDRLELVRPIDLVGTLRPLWRGPGDPTMRLAASSVARACQTPDGPGAMVVDLVAGTARVRAWGPGAAWLAAHAPAFLGFDDDDAGFEPTLHPVVARLARGRPGLHLGRTGLVFDALLPAVLEQKITGQEAFRSYRRLIHRHGSAAPGPTGLHVPPSAAVIARLPSWSWPPLGIEPRRGALLRRIAAETPRLEALAVAAREPGGGGAGASVLATRLRAFAGVGPWTAAEVTLRALGDPDAVSIGDAHLPDLVAWTLAGEIRGTDARMLELLAPWAGHRARVMRLLESGGSAPPRFGPRVAPRDISRIDAVDR
ncbi:MAG TPA: hypothetical protein VKR30_02365 [Candidatus Limnocylindrales bacterium]|nr:hypothetical protein [Candidatus Limnocylindrales bacterium]